MFFFKKKRERERTGAASCCHGPLFRCCTCLPSVIHALNAASFIFRMAVWEEKLLKAGLTAGAFGIEVAALETLNWFPVSSCSKELLQRAALALPRALLPTSPSDCSLLAFLPQCCPPRYYSQGGHHPSLSGNRFHAL